jgi:hypothetical protein
VVNQLANVSRLRAGKSIDWGCSDADDEIDGHSGEEIDIVVAHIRRLARTASLEFALRVGAVIIHHFYDGDMDAWRSRGPKTASFRRLAQHPELTLSAGALYRCVALFELCERLNAPSRWEHLGASHLRLVLGLPPAAQERLLALANSKRWTVKVLQLEVLKQKYVRVTMGGRRADPPIAKSLRRVQKCLEEHRDLIEQGESLSFMELEESTRLIDATRQILERLSNAISVRASFDGGAANETAKPS